MKTNIPSKITCLRGRASRCLLKLWYPISWMRVDIWSQFVRCNTPINRTGNCNDIFSRRDFFLAQIKPLPHMPLPYSAIFDSGFNGICERNLTTNNSDNFLKGFF